MKELQEKVQKFTRDRNWEQFHTEENLAKSIAIEASELLECFQWNNDYNKQLVQEELADVLNYCILLANKLDVDVEKIVLDKMKKNEEKYPISKSFGNSYKYTELN